MEPLVLCFVAVVGLIIAGVVAIVALRTGSRHSASIGPEGFKMDTDASGHNRKE
jgi:hypothetical protein